MNRTFSGKRPFNGYQLCSCSQKLLHASVFRVNANSYTSSHRISRQHSGGGSFLFRTSFFAIPADTRLAINPPRIEKPFPCSPGRIYAPIHTSGGSHPLLSRLRRRFFGLRPARTFCFREKLLRIPRKTHPKMKKALAPAPPPRHSLPAQHTAAVSSPTGSKVSRDTPNERAALSTG